MRQIVGVWPAVAAANGKVVSLQHSMKMADGETMEQACARFLTFSVLPADGGGPLLSTKSCVLFQENIVEGEGDAGKEGENSAESGKEVGKGRSEYPH